MPAFLHWESDPLLLDPTPLKQNTWLTANELMEKGHNDKFLIETRQLLLYPIIIRKVDFIFGERILQSFPYILLDQEWISKIRKQSLAHAEKAHHYFLDSNISKSIRNWQRKIISYLEEQQRLPFPLFRLFPSWETFFHGKQYIQFQSARGEHFQLPLYLTEELAYLSGVIMGDGHLANYFVNIIDSSKEHIENLVNTFERAFQTNIEFFPQKNAQAWNINVLSKWIVRYFNFLSGQPISERKYPHLREPLLFQDKPSFRSAFWRGLMDADGSYKNVINFSTVSESLFNDFKDFLSQKNIRHRIYKNLLYGVETFAVNIDGNYRKQFASVVGTHHPQKRLELTQLLAKRVNRFSPKPQTLLNSGTWSGQVLDFQKEKFIEGFFDFSLCPNFCIATIGSLIKNLRRKTKQKDFADIISIHKTKLSCYERNINAIPISRLAQIFSKTNYSFTELYKEHPKLTVHVSRSKCMVDTKPNAKLLHLLQGIQLKDASYFLLIGNKQQPIEDYKQEFCNYFSINKPKNRTFYNAVLTTFVKEFFICKDKH